MPSKRLSLLLALIMILSTCIMPAYANGAAEYTVQNEPVGRSSGDRGLHADGRLDGTDRSSGEEWLEYGGQEASNPYGAEKLEQEPLLQSAASLGKLEASSGNAYGELAYEHLRVFSEDIGARVSDCIYGYSGGYPELEAREYLADELDKLGYDVSFQPFTFTVKNVVYQSANVIAKKAGISDRKIIIGAHYDSVSPEPVLVKADKKEVITVAEAVYMYGKGADDNASGVAIMLEAAERIAALETPYAVEFVAFGAEERGLRGSKYYVMQMSDADIAAAVAMINLDSCIAGDNMYVYGTEGEKGWVRELALDIAERLGLDLMTQAGLNPEYPAGTTGLWSDHAPFAAKGIPYAYFEATNWALGAMDGYTQAEEEYGINGEIWHTGYDNIDYIASTFPGRIEKRLGTFSQVLTNLLLQLKAPGENVEGMNLNDYLVSVSKAEELEVTADLGYMPKLDKLEWTLGGEGLSQWKKYDAEDRAYTGEPFITFAEAPSLNGTLIKAKLRFDLPYGTENLNGTPRRLYPALLGSYRLEIKDTVKEKAVGAVIKYNAYDSYHAYDELKPSIDKIIEDAKPDRYIEYKSLGKTVEGRDAHFVIMAEDKKSVDQYLNETMELMLQDPQELQDRIADGTMGDYKIPVWFNNIHPDEAPGIDAILTLFEEFATKDIITYQTTGSNKIEKTPSRDGTNVEEPSEESQVSIEVGKALDNVIFLFNFTENPDGRYYNTRANVNGFDINRDNVYQTQVEARLTTSEIVRWKPVSFLDFHGFMPGFCIEPCTTPHDPNFEYDLLIENMLEQAHLMGKAGIANTKYSNYEIPFEDYNGGWDDAVPSYTAVFAMMLGALGHTIEIPELNEDSMDALVAAGMASVKFVTENKDSLFDNQLECYDRSLHGIDAAEKVDPWLQDASGEVVGRPRGENENFFPEYYVIPVDSQIQKNTLEAYKLAGYLLRNGIKLERSTEEVAVGAVTYPWGSFVIDMRQPLRAYANEILYDGYDVSDFAMMYAEIINAFHDTRGFDRYEVREAGAFEGKTEGVKAVEIPGTVLPAAADYYVIINSNNDAVRAVNELLNKGMKVELLLESGNGYGKGDYLVSREAVETIREDHLLEVVPYKGDTRKAALVKPRVAAPSATGHLTFALKELGFDISGNTSAANIIVTDANANVSAEIDSGKPYVGIGGSAMRFVRNTLGLEGFDYMSSGYEALMRCTVAQDSLITANYAEDSVIYNAKGGYISSVPEGAKVLTRINDDDSYFKAGWWPDTDVYEGIDYGKLEARGKALSITTGAGASGARLIVFANNLVNKAHPQNDWRMLANAVFTSLINTISPSNAVFDKHTSKQQDIKVAVYGSLDSIKYGTNVLTAGTDYTISGDEVTLKASYLAKLPLGKASLTFCFKTGESRTLSLTVTESTTSSSGRSSGSKSGSAIKVADNYRVVLSYEALNADNKPGRRTTKYQTALGLLELPVNMLTGTGLAKAGDSIGISLKRADIGSIPEALRKKIGSRPVFDIGLDVNGVRKPWSNPDAPVTISVKYVPDAEELKHPDNIVIWYLDETSGLPAAVPNCKYDPVSGTVTFTVTHFSKYALVYSLPELKDIDECKWAEKEISAIVAKGILEPAGDAAFMPGGNITRGDFMYGLVRALGLSAGFEGKFSDISSSDYYYRELGIARALGIAHGTGNNEFMPEKEITRQDIMVLTVRALKAANKLGSTTATDMSAFEDGSEIAAYARESVGIMTANGIIIGSGSRINPGGTATRAEAAVILYRILNRQ